MVQYLVIFKILATCGSTFALQGCSKSKKNKSQGGNASTVCDEPVDRPRPGNRWLNRYGGPNPHGAISPEQPFDDTNPFVSENVLWTAVQDSSHDKLDKVQSLIKEGSIES